MELRRNNKIARIVHSLPDQHEGLHDDIWRPNLPDSLRRDFSIHRTLPGKVARLERAYQFLPSLSWKCWKIRLFQNQARLGIICRFFEERKGIKIRRRNPSEWANWSACIEKVSWKLKLQQLTRIDRSCTVWGRCEWSCPSSPSRTSPSSLCLLFWAPVQNLKILNKNSKFMKIMTHFE